MTETVSDLTYEQALSALQGFIGTYVNVQVAACTSAPRDVEGSRSAHATVIFEGFGGMGAATPHADAAGPEVEAFTFWLGKDDGGGAYGCFYVSERDFLWASVIGQQLHIVMTDRIVTLIETSPETGERVEDPHA